MHNTRCANIIKFFQSAMASSAFIGRVGQAGIKALLVPRQWQAFKADTWIGFMAVVWEISEGNHGKLVSAMSGSAAQALTASLSTTLGPKGPCIRTSFTVTVVGFCIQLCARSEFKRQLPG